MGVTHEWVDRDDLLSALGRSPADSTLEWFGITRRQFQSWAKKTSTRQPIALARLIRYRQRFHLAELLGKDWDGFTAHGPALEFPGLNRALPMQELKSLWFHIQQVALLEAPQRTPGARSGTARCGNCSIGMQFSVLPAPGEA